MAKKTQYHFVLSKEDENSGLKEHMETLAGQKQLTAKIKTALTLLAQLEQGNTEMLDTMFPQLRAEPKAAPTPTPPDSGDLDRRIESAVEAGVQKAIQNLPALPAGRMVAEPAYKESGAGIGTMAGQGSTIKKAVAMPTFDDIDDDMDTLVLKESTTRALNPFENLLASMTNVDEKSEQLYAERLAAGLIDPRSGRLIEAQQ